MLSTGQLSWLLIAFRIETFVQANKALPEKILEVLDQENLKFVWSSSFKI